MIDPKEEVLEVVELDGIPALFIEERIGRESIPAGLYCYDIRHDDECQGNGCEIQPYVRVNFWATVITKEKIPMNNGSYLLKDAVDFQGYAMTLEEFIEMDFNESEGCKLEYGN